MHYGRDIQGTKSQMNPDQRTDINLGYRGYGYRINMNVGDTGTDTYRAIASLSRHAAIFCTRAGISAA